MGPLFSVLIGRWLDLVWADLGEPAPFIVAEAGAGRGALAAGVLAARPRCSAALRYLTIERSAALRASQQELLDERVRSLAALEQLDDAHVVLANELLDNLAPRVLQRRRSRSALASRGWSRRRPGCRPPWSAWRRAACS